MAAKSSLIRNIFSHPFAPGCTKLPACPTRVNGMWRGFSTAPLASSHSQQSFGPSVRLLLTLYDLQPQQVVASGPHGRLLKGDVLNYISNNRLEPKPYQSIAAQPLTVSAPSPAAAVLESLPSKPPRQPTTVVLEDGEEFRDLDLSSMRRTIAKRLTLSKTTIPHVYSSVDCQMTKLTASRKQLAQDGVKVSVNDFIVKACAVALQRIPSVNCIWSNDDIQPLSQVDIAISVATDNGLITPIVTQANEKSVAEISSNIRELAGRGREGKLRPHEIQGGSFTVSNLGMFGITTFKAVVNPPQACILAVGGSQVEMDELGRLITKMNITLSSDGRIVDDMLAGKFLNEVKDLLENPASMGL